MDGSSDTSSKEIVEAEAIGYTILLACCKALAKACTVAKRCCGALARAVSNTSSTSNGTSGFFMRTGGGGFIICWVAISRTEP